jgi:hypothetical protein
MGNGPQPGNITTRRKEESAMKGINEGFRTISRAALTKDGRKTDEPVVLTTDDLEKVAGGSGGYTSYGYSRFGYGAATNAAVSIRAA